MSSPGATMLQKLTFVVLVGILAALVVIIVQNQNSHVEPVAANEESPTVETPPTEPELPTLAAPPPGRPALEERAAPSRAFRAAIASPVPPRREARPIIGRPVIAQPMVVEVAPEPVAVGAVAVAEAAVPAGFVAVAPAAYGGGSIKGRVALRGTP